MVSFEVECKGVDARGPRRVLVAKLGLDGHDVGAKVVAHVLRDAGFEVVYLGIRQSPEVIVTAALQEDVDVIGVSILSGAHIPLVSRLVELLEQAGGRLPVIVGGVIPKQDRDQLIAIGVEEIVDASVNLEKVVEMINEVIESSRSQA